MAAIRGPMLDSATGEPWQDQLRCYPTSRGFTLPKSDVFKYIESELISYSLSSQGSPVDVYCDIST